MTRICITLPPAIAKAAQVKARAERRSLSSYVALLMEQDLQVAKAEASLLREARRLGVDVPAVLKRALLAPVADFPGQPSVPAAVPTQPPPAA